MDERQQWITEDLSGILDGEVRCDPFTLAQYASDGSLYQICPLGVVYPRHSDDVTAVASYSAEKEIPLVARGSGSQVAGGALGEGLIVDFSRYMNRIESIDGETVRVQAGVVRDELNRALKSQGRYFAPDPSNTEVTTVGGMIAVDAAGSHSVRVGSVRDHVKSIEMVLAGGATFEVGDEAVDANVSGRNESSSSSAESDNSTPFESTRRTLVSKLSKLLVDNESVILERQPALIRNCSGYFLRNINANGRLNLPRMLVGSEGTLGLFTAATLHTSQIPEHRGVALLLFGQVESAMRTVLEIMRFQPSACDLMDRRLLSLAREADETFAQLISPAAEAAIILEQTGFTERGVKERLQSILKAVRMLNTRAVVASEVYEPDEVEFLWSLPNKVVPLLARLKGASRPLPFIEDISVPPEAVHDFMKRAQKVLQQHQVTASLYAHAAAGQLHLRPFMPMPRPEDAARVEAIARDIYQAVFAVGGTISGEHGDGLARTAFIRSQYGPLYKVFQQVKDLFDPHNLMNPGKIVSDDPHVTLKNLRPVVEPTPELFDLKLQWNAEEIATEAAECNGCGRCRTTDPLLRMCPFFRDQPIEEATPRAKANVMRQLLSGALDVRHATSEEMQHLSQLCFNCKQCQLECPSNVNIPHLMIEAKAEHVAANGLSRADWILSRAHSLGAMGSVLAPVSNWVISNPNARWVLEKVMGIARQRKLPRQARRPFLRTVSQRLLKMPLSRSKSDAVVYFVGDYANYYDPELARAFVAVLQHHGIPIYIPPEQVSSGMAMISAGDLEAAREIADRNVRCLAEAAREGCTIVCTEPSAAVSLKTEYPILIDNPDVNLVASQTVEAGDYLLQLHREGKLRTDFDALKLQVGYHTPCHLKSLEKGTPLHELIQLIPELEVISIEKGCSGMAGAYGLTQKNFRKSVRLGWDLISRMREPDLDVGCTECCSCKMQMEQGTTTPTIHPIKLLALAYGLMPEIRKKLSPSNNRLVVT